MPVPRCGNEIFHRGVCGYGFHSVGQHDVHMAQGQGNKTLSVPHGRPVHGRGRLLFPRASSCDVCQLYAFFDPGADGSGQIIAKRADGHGCLSCVPDDDTQFFLCAGLSSGMSDLLPAGDLT